VASRAWQIRDGFSLRPSETRIKTSGFFRAAEQLRCTKGGQEALATLICLVIALAFLLEELLPSPPQELVGGGEHVPAA
jgi:hypothetical protein